MAEGYNSNAVSLKPVELLRTLIIVCVTSASGHKRTNGRHRGTLPTSLFHVSLSGHCCPHHRVGVVIGPEGSEFVVSDSEDEREITVVGPAGRRHPRTLMTEHHDRVVGGDKLMSLDNQIGQLPADDVKPSWPRWMPRHGTSTSGSCHSISSSSTAIRPGTSCAPKHRNTS